MYISAMSLDTSKRATMLALITPGMIHGAVETAFPGERKRRLWRIDCVNGENRLLIVSEDKPDLSSAVNQFGFPDRLSCQTKDYSPLLERVSVGTRWRFRLTANPTVSFPDKNEKGKRGEVQSCNSVKYQEKWLSDRARKHGFNLGDDDFSVVGNRWYAFEKHSDQKRTVSLLAVTYEGILTVTDSDLFRSLLTDGIGRGKAYGMGMMTVIQT